MKIAKLLTYKLSIRAIILYLLSAVVLMIMFIIVASLITKTTLHACAQSSMEIEGLDWDFESPALPTEAASWNSKDFSLSVNRPPPDLQKALRQLYPLTLPGASKIKYLNFEPCWQIKASGNTILLDANGQLARVNGQSVIIGNALNRALEGLFSDLHKRNVGKPFGGKSFLK